jgi:Mn2+/Fe2+ NRAMP family transporter
MGEFANSRLTHAIAVIATALVLGLNAFLIVEMAIS